MKTCPVCRAGAFDDAEVCYGCLHRFSQGDAQAFVASSVTSAPNSSESGGAVGVDVACEDRAARGAGSPQACTRNLSGKQLPPMPETFYLIVALR